MRAWWSIPRTTRASVRPTSGHLHSPNGLRHRDELRADYYPCRDVVKPSTSKRGFSTSAQRNHHPDTERLIALLPSKRGISPESDSLAGRPSKHAHSIGKVLLSAHETKGVNLLHELAVGEERWADAVWLIRQILQGTKIQSPSTSDQLDVLVEQTEAGTSLAKLTDHSIGHKNLSEPTHQKGPRFTRSIQAVVDSDLSATINGINSWQHRVLGIVWTALGTMTIASIENANATGVPIRAEILEILALFHHHGFISPSVYSFVPIKQSDAIQQPMVLHLLSAHIMTALTDAEWRAKDRDAIADAEASGKDTRSMRLELRGAAMRSTTGAVRPELWLELILWSCLHGGWRASGLKILHAVSSSSSCPAWTATSWRANLRKVIPFGDAASMDWESLRFELDTRRSARAAPTDITNWTTRRTISSEVVTAYVDAFIAQPVVMGRIDGVSLKQVLKRFVSLKSFLQRSGVTLQHGSWASVVQRLVLDNAVTPLSLSHLDLMEALIPKIGEEPDSSSNSDLPAYVFDASAALLGLQHRSLTAHISNGNISAAEHIFRLIDDGVNEARVRSTADFFRAHRLQSAQDEHQSQFSFSANFDGIDYPLFDAQIPPYALATYVDLLTDSQRFVRAKELLSENDSNNVYLSRQLRRNTTVHTSLLRLAIVSNDPVLQDQLTKLDVTDSSSSIDKALFAAQLEAGDWQSAVTHLLKLRSETDMDWDAECLAIVTKHVLIHDEQHSVAGDAGGQYATTWTILNSMIAEIKPVDLSRRPASNRSMELFSILCTLAIVDARFLPLLQRFSQHSLRPTFHCPSGESLRVLIAAVARSKGSRIARDLIMTLSRLNHAAIGAQVELVANTDNMPSNAYGRPERGRPQVKAIDGTIMVLRSSMVPTMSIIRPVVQHGLAEWKQANEVVNDRHSRATIYSPADWRSWAEEVLLAGKGYYTSTLDIRREIDQMVEASVSSGVTETLVANQQAKEL